MASSITEPSAALTKVLLVEDNSGDRRAWVRCATQRKWPYDYTLASSLADAIKILARQRFDIAVLNEKLGDGASSQLFSALKAQGCPFIICADSGDENAVRHLRQQGAADYLIKDPDRAYLNVLPIAVETTLLCHRLGGLLRQLDPTIESVRDVLLIVDDPGLLKFIHPDLAQYCQISRHKAIGHPVGRLGQPALTALFENGDVVFHPRWIPGQPVPLWDGTGSPISLVLAIGCVEDSSRRFRVAIARDIAQLQRSSVPLGGAPENPQNPDPLEALETLENSQKSSIQTPAHTAQLLASQISIQQQQQFLRLVLDTNPSFIFVKDREGRYLLANQTMADFYGVSVAAILGNTDAALGCTDQDQARFLQENQLVIEKQQACFIPEEEVNHPERGVQWLQWHKQPIRLPEQDRYAVLGVGVNITERKRSELALRESEKRFSTLAAVIPVGIFRTDIEGNCLYVNDRWCEIAGITPTAAQDKGWAQALHPDDRDATMAAWLRAIQAQHPMYLECRFLRPDGQISWVVAQSEVERDIEGNIQGFVGTLTDISDRKQTEDQLRLTSQGLQEAQRLAHLGNWEQDLQQNTLYWSEEIFRIFEVDPQQSQPSCEAFLNLIHPEDRPTADATYRQHLRDRQPYSLVHRMVMADGRIKYVREHCATVFSADGTPLISRGTAQDITQQQEAEMRRDRAEASLRQVIEGTAAVTGKDFFPALVRHIAEALGVRYVAVSQATPEGFQVLAFFADGELCPPPFLPYEVVPCCRQSLQIGSCCHPAEIQALYPDNPLFTDLQAESYLGVRLCNAAGEATGNLCLLHDRPLADPGWAKTLLSIFAARAGAELERLLTAQALEHLNTELEARVAQRTAELAEREALLQDFLDNVNDLIQMVDIDTGRFEFVNRAWQNVLGYSAAEVAQLTCFDVLAPECHPHCQAIFAHMRSGDITHLDQMELIFVSKSGQRVVVEGNVNCRFVTETDGSQRPVSTRGIFRDVTARKAAEQELQRREARYRALMEGASDAILLANTEGYLVEVNPQALDLMGYEHHELVGMHITQIHPPEALPAATAAFETLAQEGRIEALNLEILRRDGQRVPVDITGSVIEVGGETIIQGIFHDIRERLQAEQALRASEQRYATLAQTVPVAIFRFDLEGHCTYVNERWSAITGKPSALAMGDRWLETMHPDDREHSQTLALQWLQADMVVPFQNEARILRDDGSIVWFYCQMLVETDANGKQIGYVGTLTDITDRKQAEAALRDSEARFRRVFESNVVGMMFTDFRGRISDANDRFLAMLGYTRQDMEAGCCLNWADLTPPDYQAQDQAAIVYLQHHDTIQPWETTYRHKDGHLVPVLVGKAILSRDQGSCVAVVVDISDRKRYEIALQESQQFLQTVLDTVPLAVFWKDQASNYLGANQRFLHNASLGSASALVGKTDFEMPWGATEATAYRADDRHVMESGTAKLGIIESQRQQDGTDIWVETNKLPLRNLAGEVVGVLGTYQDITERQNAKLALQRQLAAIEAAVNGIAILQDERYLYLNSSHVELFGYQSPQELIGQSWRVLYSPEELERFDQEIWPALHQQMFWRGEVIATRKDGTTFPENLSLTLSADNLLICVCEDISDRRQAELALQDSETRFRRVFASNVVGMMFTDFSGQVTDANDRFLDIIGYSRADLEAHRINWVQITPPEYVEADQRAIAQLQHYGEILPWEKEYLRPDGHRVAVLIGVALLSETDGRCVCVVLDISDLKAAEAELRHTNAELARATRLKDEFLASMSHELRTPLNAILGMTEGLQEEIFGGINTKQTNALRTVETSAYHLLALINDILDLAKIEAGQITLEPSQVSVEQVCASSMAFIKQQALKKRIHLTTTLPPHLPSLFVDERRIRQTLLNLLSNAVKFTPEGGTVTLSVSPLPPDSDGGGQHYLRMAVTDTGIGIAPEDMGKLFQPFVQIDSALNRKYTGTGLGLALVKQIVELHGGRVGLTSDVGVGSCFTLDLPYEPQTASGFVPEPPPAIAPTGSPPPVENLASDLAPLILLAEDNPANIESIACYLEAKAYRLVLANNGQEAIDLALSYQPDVILMDIQMPGMDGLEAMRQIRQQPSLQGTPIIALTALAMQGDRERCLAAGANHYLSKPLKLKQLDLAIREFLTSNHL